MFKDLVDGLNTLCNTNAHASTTIFALLLTLLSLSSSSKLKLKEEHYIHVFLIAKVVTAVFMAAVKAFLFFKSSHYGIGFSACQLFRTIYYVTLGVLSILSSSLMVVERMLYNTIVNIMKVIGTTIKRSSFAMQEDIDDSEL